MGFMDEVKGLGDKAKDLGEKAKDAVGEHSGQIKAAVDKVGDVIDDKTGDKFKDKIDKGQHFVSEQVDKLGKDQGTDGTAGTPATPVS